MSCFDNLPELLVCRARWGVKFAPRIPLCPTTNLHVFFFLFFFDTLSSLLRRIYYHQVLSFQESVGHISCTIWSSPQLSTYDVCVSVTEKCPPYRAEAGLASWNVCKPMDWIPMTCNIPWSGVTALKLYNFCQKWTNTTVLNDILN